MNKSIVRIISIHILDGPAYSPPGRTVRLMLWYRGLELAFGHQSLERSGLDTDLAAAI
ncbi:hypothetical protein BQ8482_220112 [Mesorhizobium delmotii]|uniref:Uncharacterized protein n=1 Tax=Mesorhizobium delmotii TaxID=1631247 RepID=A0A2P9ALB9_9HYPH|nr:hypothetical protein BQ8482_220112 [Mesorhizobium delmotii]